MSVMFQEGL